MRHDFQLQQRSTITFANGAVDIPHRFRALIGQQIYRRPLVQDDYKMPMNQVMQ